jgi:hypothetical protein
MAVAHSDYAPRLASAEMKVLSFCCLNLHLSRCFASCSGRPSEKLHTITAPHLIQTDWILARSSKSLRTKVTGFAISNINSTFMDGRMLFPGVTIATVKFRHCFAKGRELAYAPAALGLWGSPWRKSRGHPQRWPLERLVPFAGGASRFALALGSSLLHRLKLRKPILAAVTLFLK